MTPDKVLFMQMMVKFGFDTATIIWENMNKAANVDDGIAALKASRGKTWDDYKQKEQ